MVTRDADGAGWFVRNSGGGPSRSTTASRETATDDDSIEDASGDKRASFLDRRLTATNAEGGMAGGGEGASNSADAPSTEGGAVEERWGTSNSRDEPSSSPACGLRGSDEQAGKGEYVDSELNPRTGRTPPTSPGRASTEGR